MSYNIHTKEFRSDIIEGIDRVTNKNMVCSSFTCTNSIKHTVDHPFYVKGKGWCSLKPELTDNEKHTLPGHRIGKLVRGDKVMLLDGDNLVESTYLGTDDKFIKNDRTVVTISKLRHNTAFLAGGVVVGVYGVREK